MSGFRFNFEDLPPEYPSIADNNNNDSTSESERHEKKMAGNDDTRTQAPLVILENVGNLLRERFHEPIRYDTIPLCNDQFVSTPLLRARESSSYLSANTADGFTTTSHGEEIVQELERKQTDMLPGVYEGGLKVWECSIDLCQYLVKQWLVPPESDQTALEIPRNGYIMELGCGHALPGCLVLRQELMRRSSSGEELANDKPFSILLSEYNEFVLRDVTLSNIVLNTNSLCEDKDTDQFMDIIARHVALAGGDWMELSKSLQAGSLPQQQQINNAEITSQPRLPPDGRFDLILAAETTYTADAAHDTAILMARHLKKDVGVGLVATKRFYFGVGGGSSAFCEAAARVMVPADDADTNVSEYRLQVDTVQVHDNGIGNIRELLSVRCV